MRLAANRDALVQAFADGLYVTFANATGRHR